jgi:site-specific recombinase XerD
MYGGNKNIEDTDSAYDLRPSFRTDFLEAGTDIEYIQNLLGYRIRRNTGIYIHASNKDICGVISRLDTGI